MELYHIAQSTTAMTRLFLGGSLANAAAGALLLCAARQSLVITDEALQRARAAGYRRVLALQ